MRAALVIALFAAACSYERLPALGDGDARADDASPADAPTDAPADAPTDAPDDVDAPDAASCSAGARRCAGNQLEECQGGTWTALLTCEHLCAQGGCVTPPSCNGGGALCGNGTETCCRSLPVPGGMFSRSFDGVTTGYTDDRYRATLTGFHLDAYEVTVQRFQQFASAYPASKPAVASGRNPRDAADPGWKPEWTALLPAGRTELDAMLVCDSVSSQMTHLPVRCVTWYVAQAFCIWDGGRLPTEAEWNYAASGGELQRVYPWSMPAASTTITAGEAVYAETTPVRPGARAAGNARWGHADLAGNAAEWVFDNHVTPYPSETCNDCANHTASAARGVRGGSYASVAAVLRTSPRSSSPPANRYETVGFRCARDPLP